MIYESGKMQLQVVATKFVGEVNDCYICRDMLSPGGILYTVIVVHKHEAVRDVLSLFSLSGRNGKDILIDDFSYGEKHIYVFPYYRERPLSRFYDGESMILSQCEDVCINIILACITSDLPYPILYLLLKDDMLQISGDRSVFWGYELKLENLDISIGESECARVCADILLDLLKPKAGQKATSYYLLQKKTENGSYSKFTDLYRDITIASVSKKKITPLVLFKLWIKKNSDRIIGILFWISLILAVLTLSIILSSVFLGGNSWIRLFFNTFKKIGTENLTQ
ncbi:MAG: hypothetical protein K6A61_07005 [Butyrivibrio sp.]|nr:hypothetical protein [Butyrivibrio sp.]